MAEGSSSSLDRVFLRACAVAMPQEWAGREADLRALDARRWRTLVELAIEHALVGLVARNVSWAAEETGIAIPVLEPLAALRRGQLVQQLNRKACARRVADALVQRDIPFIAFKGVALAEEYYGDLSLRGFRDFDVMVPRERLDEAYSLLLDMGYRLPQFKHVRDWVDHGAHAVGMAHADGSGVDLHWSIAPDVLEPERVAVIWAHTRPAAHGAFLPGLRLSPEMTLIHLAKHFHSHQYGELKPLVDFYVAARRIGASIDSSRLVSAAEAMGLLPVVDIAARVCERCFIPGALPPLLGPRAHGLQARIAARVLTDRFLLDSARLPRLTNWLRYLAAAGSVRAALASVVGFLVPGKLLLTQFFNQPFEVRMYPRYYWRQLVKVVTFANK
jgi:hypothetical protein